MNSAICGSTIGTYHGFKSNTSPESRRYKLPLSSIHLWDSGIYVLLWLVHWNPPPPHAPHAPPCHSGFHLKPPSSHSLVRSPHPLLLTVHIFIFHKSDICCLALVHIFTTPQPTNWYQCCSFQVEIPRYGIPILRKFNTSPLQLSLFPHHAGEFFLQRNWV